MFLGKSVALRCSPIRSGGVKGGSVARLLTRSGVRDGGHGKWR